MIISKVISTVIKNSRLIVKALIYGKSDVRNAYSVSPFGIDSNIPSGYRGIYSNTGNEEEKILIGVINEKAVADVGELRLYSEDSGTKKAEIFLKKNGIIELNGNSDFAVRFNALESGFNQLRSDLNSHTHLIPVYTAPIGTPAPTPAPIVPSTASISAAKNSDILTN